VDGVYFPETVRIRADEPPLLLNGAGMRRILMFRVYVAGLYLPARRTTTQEVLALKGPKRVLLVIQRNEISSRQLIDHLEQRLNDGRQPAQMAVLKTRMDDLYRIIDAEKVIHKGGTIALDYEPGVGTQVVVNGTPKGEPIPGENFYNALLGIWLGEGAPSAGLREAMLGH
jgi:hypothetical protein